MEQGERNAIKLVLKRNVRSTYTRETNSLQRKPSIQKQKTDLDLQLPVAFWDVNVRHADDPGLAGDALYGAHEDVGHDGHGKEAPEEA